MAIDFNPMLARSLAKEQMAMQGAYGLGQLLGSEATKGKVNELKGKVNELNLLGMAKEGLSKVPKIKDISMPQLEGIREKLMNIMPGGLIQSMTDDKGLFRGGMNDRVFGRLRDETDILNSRAKGAIRNLPSQVKGALSQFPLQGKGQNITMYKNGQIVPRKPVVPPLSAS